MLRCRVEESLRILLGHSSYENAVDAAQGKPIHAIFLDDDRTTIGAGTPPTSKTADIRPSFFVEAAYFQGVQTPAKKRLVGISPMMALKQLDPAFDSGRKRIVTKLAKTLIKIVVECKLLRGYSAICVAGACTLAAESALAKTITYRVGLDKVGVSPHGICSAFKTLKVEMAKNLQVRSVIVKAKGNPCRFPGKLKGEKTFVAESLTGALCEDMRTRGGSPLRAVIHADEVPDLQSANPKNGRFYAALQGADMIFDFEGDDEDEDQAYIVLPAFDYAFAYLAKTASAGQAVGGCDRPGRDNVMSYGMMLGNLVM